MTLNTEKRSTRRDINNKKPAKCEPESCTKGSVLITSKNEAKTLPFVV